MMIEKRIKIIPEKILPQQEVEYFVVNDKEFKTKTEAQEYVRDTKVDDAFKSLTNDMNGWPFGVAYYGSYGEKKITPRDDSFKSWLADNSQFVMQFYNEIGDLDNETK